MTADDLKKMRKDAGLTQGELAERLGMGLRAIQDMEAGKSPVREVHRLALVGLGLGSETISLDDVAGRQVRSYVEKIDLAERSLVMIDENGMTFHEASAHEPLHDVTVRRRQEIVENIEAYKHALFAWRMALNGPTLKA